MYHTQALMLSTIRGITAHAADQQESAQHAQQRHAAQLPVMRCSNVLLATIDIYTLYPRQLSQEKRHTAAFCTTEAQHMRKSIFKEAHSSILHHRGTTHAQTHMLRTIRGITTRAADQQEHAAVSTAHAASETV